MQIEIVNFLQLFCFLDHVNHQTRLNWTFYISGPQKFYAKVFDVTLNEGRLQFTYFNMHFFAYRIVQLKVCFKILPISPQNFNYLCMLELMITKQPNIYGIQTFGPPSLSRPRVTNLVGQTLHAKQVQDIQLPVFLLTRLNQEFCIKYNVPYKGNQGRESREYLYIWIPHFKIVL